MKLHEVNPNTFKGSLGPGLIDSKFWLLTELSNIKSTFDSIYILGSWYGSMSVMLALDPRINYDKLINVETKRRYLRVSKKFVQLAGENRVESMLKDANDLDYRQLGTDGLVINTSCGNISGNQWFDNIPQGTLVALQGRNNDPRAINQFDTFKEFVNSYKLTNILFRGIKNFKDPETNFESYLLIGIR